MSKARRILRVAVPTPLRTLFDYLPPRGVDVAELRPGQRLSVPFGRQRVTGVLLEIVEDAQVEATRLKAAHSLLDPEPVLPEDMLQLLGWASRYYHHPVGEVVSGALPTALRKGNEARATGPRVWQLTEQGAEADAGSLKRAPRQAELLMLLQQRSGPVRADEIEQHVARWRDPMRRLTERGWVEVRNRPCLEPGPDAGMHPGPELNADQHAAVEAVTGALDEFGVFLLDGVTGSGKTEVYLGVIEAVIARGRQALVMVPEISLTPQTVARFRQRFAVPAAALHSGLGEQERLCAWLMAAQGLAPIVIGTRSAVFTPLRSPGVIIIDEEHDLSFKQQEGFRYHARDLAVMRAHRAGIPVVLGSATPSLESLHNAECKRYRELTLPERVGNARPPAIHLIDVRKQPMQQGMSATLRDIIHRHLDQGGQALLFLNRRGYAPTLLCHGCGWVASCPRCDARMTLHQGRGRLCCHHCGHERAIDATCPECQGDDLRPLGQGTERIETVLQQDFPDVGIARIDRDSTRRRGAMQRLLDDIHAGRTRLLIGTQMLAKGHHFPEITLVGIVDVDYGLFGADFRASERMAQLILQVAGRAGRAERPGEVYVQTHHPEHPLLHTLVTRGYRAFARDALMERRDAALPPFVRLALLRAEAVDRDTPLRFLADAAGAARPLAGGGTELIGPVPAPMERRAGRYRAQLLVQADNRGNLHQLLDDWLPKLEGLSSARRVRWSLDVDPMEML